jgi:hypothetical protein
MPEPREQATQTGVDLQYRNAGTETSRTGVGGLWAGRVAALQSRSGRNTCYDLLKITSTMPEPGGKSAQAGVNLRYRNAETETSGTGVDGLAVGREGSRLAVKIGAQHLL